MLQSCALLALPVLFCAPAFAQWAYPPTPTVDVADTYFGKTYKDPYRWLENRKDKAVEGWFKAQADLTDGILAKIPGSASLAQEWLALDKLKPARFSYIIYVNGRVFYKKTLGGENIGKLYYREGWTGAEKLLLEKVNYDDGHFTEEKLVTFKNFAGQCAFLLWQTGHKEFQPSK